jgi:hypothetical protein
MPLIDLTYWNTIQQLMSVFPGTEESTSYGTPAFKVKKKLLLRLKEDGITLVIHTDDRDIWLDDDPNVFFVTEHYFNYPFVLVRLDKIKKTKLREIITQSWKEIAPNSLLKEYEQQPKKKK